MSLPASAHEDQLAQLDLNRSTKTPSPSLSSNSSTEYFSADDNGIPCATTSATRSALPTGTKYVDHLSTSPISLHFSRKEWAYPALVCPCHLADFELKIYRDEAADATVGVPHASSQRITPGGTKSKPSNGAYAVFFGHVPGFFLTWAQAQLSVTGVSGALYQGYLTPEAASAAFEYTRSVRWTGVITDHSPAPCIMVSTAHMPASVSSQSAVSPLHRKTWYIVYKGINPGVYQSSLECGLNMIGVSGSIFDSVDNVHTANDRFVKAQAAGRTRPLPFPCTI
ncbi:hypothetical protein B0H13DRAFT_2338308 [Mycena leptocephala]|nr:hypothetical protein B0H13DRAFT_2338308 [Mycena leptocephala]